MDIEACANVNQGGSRRIDDVIATLQTATRFLRDFVVRHFHDLVTGTAPRVGSWYYQDPEAEPWMTASGYRQWLHNDRRNRAWMHLQQLNQLTNVVTVNFHGLEPDGTLLPYHEDGLRPQPLCPTSSTQAASSSQSTSSHVAPPEPGVCTREPEMLTDNAAPDTTHEQSCDVDLTGDTVSPSWF